MFEWLLKSGPNKEGLPEQERQLDWKCWEIKQKVVSSTSHAIGQNNDNVAKLDIFSENIFNKIKSIIWKLTKAKNIPNYTDEQLREQIKKIDLYISKLAFSFSAKDNQNMANISNEGEISFNSSYETMLSRTLNDINQEYPYSEDNNFFEIAVFFCFEKLKQLYITNVPIDDNDINYIRTNKKLSDILFLYIESINKSKDNNTTDSYEDISYALFLLWIWEEYDIIDDIKDNDLSLLLKFIDNNIICLKEKPDIKKFELLVTTLNQLLVILGEFKETSELVYSVFTDIVNKIECLIEDFLDCKWISFVWIYRPVVYLDLINDSDIQLDYQELQYIITLQSLLAKYYVNFSEIEIYLSKYKSNLSKEENSNSIDKIVARIFKYLEHWEKLRKSVIDENRKQDGNKEIKRSEEDIKKDIIESEMLTRWNRAYTKLISIKKKEEFGIDIEEIDIINNIQDIVEMYKFKNNTISDNATPVDVIKDFIKKEKWKSLDLVCVYSLMLFCNFEPALLRKLVLAIINNTHTTSLIAEENRKVDILSLVVEQIVKKVSVDNELLICDVINCNKTKCDNPKKQVCHILIKRVEDYIEKNSKDWLFFNYSRLYLSLAYLYSSALNKNVSNNSYTTSFYVPEIDGIEFLNGGEGIDSDDTLIKPDEEHYLEYWNKTTRYYHYFMERLWNNQDFWKNELVKKINENVLNNLLPIASTSEEKSKLVIDSERKKISMQERLNLQREISDIILEIQTSDVLRKGWLDDIKNKICTTIWSVLFKWWCNIFILPPKKNANVWRFQKSERIEGKDFDIVFVYHKSYENTFAYIFNQESDYIKTNISQLIDIHEKYSKTFEYLQTVVWAASVAMGIKDTYTKWHVERVVEFSVMIGKILGLDWNDLFTLKVQAILHDYGKLFIDDNILKKPWKLSWKEIEQMSFHTWKWVEKALEHWFLPELIEWNIHHCKYYSKDWIPDLTYDKVTKQLLEHKKNSPWISFDYSLFNRLMWNNIPRFARILQLADIKDAIASRRIYEDRAWYTIEEIINTVESEFINCSWLKMNKKNFQLELDKWKWIKAETEEQKNLCYAQKEIDINWEEIIYIPNTNYRELWKVDLGFSIEFFNELLAESGLSASLESYVPCKSYKQNLTNDEKQKIKNWLFANDNDGSWFYNVWKDIVKWWGLKLNKETQKIEIDKTKWIETKTDLEKLHSCWITQWDKIYIPDPNNSVFKESVIEFDPSIVKEVFVDPKKVEELRLAIRENDKKEMADKIKEFDWGIELLTKKQKNNIQSNKCMLEELNKADLLLSEFDELNEKLNGVKGTLLQQNDLHITEFVKYLEWFISDKRNQIAKTYINLNSIMEVFNRQYNFTSEEVNNLARMKRILPKLKGFAEEYLLETSKTQDS